MKLSSLLLFAMVMLSCVGHSEECTTNTYLEYSSKEDWWSGGSKRISIDTPKGSFQVWTKRVGNNPDLKVLLLHGGPGATHEYFEIMDSFFPKASIEYYYYDQLGSGNSDNPQDESLWEIDRFVEEVEQVRQALELDSSNFVILGHSWGGILAIEYALKHQQHLKGLIISNMVASIPDYIQYANEVLGPQLPEDILLEIKALEAEGSYTSDRYLSLVESYYYPKHVLRRPLDQWPEPVNRSFSKMNYPLYLKMQGPSEFGVVGDAILKDWDRKKDLSKIGVPTLSIGGAYDTMDPEGMKYIAEQVQKGSFLLCPQGSHMSMYDDSQIYFDGVIEFLKSLN